MHKTKHGWTILEHERGVLSYSYIFDGKSASANAFAMRIKEGKMLVLSPPCNVEEGVFSDLLEYGEIAAVVASNGYHHLGLGEWRARFPKARFFADSLSVKRIRKKSSTAPAFEAMSELRDLLGDNTGVTAAPATKCGETWAYAQSRDGAIWFASDVLSNMRALPKNPIAKLIFKFTGTKAGFGIFHAALSVMVKDKKRVLRQMAEEMDENPPRMIVPAHGEILCDPDIAERARKIFAQALA